MIPTTKNETSLLIKTSRYIINGLLNAGVDIPVMTYFEDEISFMLEWKNKIKIFIYKHGSICLLDLRTLRILATDFSLDKCIQISTGILQQ